VGILAVLVGLVVALFLAYTALNQIKQLRTELDQTQRQLNETQREVNELKAAAEVIPAPPPLPRTRSSGLDDLREQLRAAHREEPSDE
jgi:hypothetical protein